MVRAGRPVLLLAMVMTLGAAVSAVVGSGAAQAAPMVGRAAPGESVPAIPGELDSVSADSATDAWAVGNSFSGNVEQPVIVHWNGTAWSQVPFPSPGTGGASLRGVSAISPTDAWAVGGFAKSATVGQTWILHWNGTAWSQVPSPNPEPSDGLNGVSAISPANVWAVGGSTNSANVGQTLIVHWNGHGWSQVKSPSPGTGGASLSSVSAASGSNAWAAGTSVVTGSPTTFKSLTLHWNGTAWSRRPSPSPGDFAQLTGVSTLSRADAWTVGTSFGPKNLALHWNGTAWSQMSMPNPGTLDKQLEGVSAVSATDAWAVGWARQNTRFEPFFTVTLRWNGTAWKRVPSPDPGNSNGEGDTELHGVDALSRTSVWAVGTYFNSDTSALDILVLHWNGTAWSMS